MRILVVDDDKAILKLVARVLRDEAYAVDTASTGEDARTLALVNEYDGIILILSVLSWSDGAREASCPRSGQSPPRA